MDRRDFLKLTAATGASATLANCGNPEHQLIRFIPEEELLPGISSWKPSICPLCPAGCGVLVRVMEGEAEVIRKGQTGIIKMGLAKKLEGNPAHPGSQGKLCARGQAGIQVTYHPDRITTPKRRSGERGSGEFREVTWDDALAELIERLNALGAANDQKSLAFITRRLQGQRQTLVEQFLNRFGAPAPVEFEVFGEEVLRRANARSFGYEQLPTFDLARSKYVIAFGADFLGTWNAPTSQSIGYGEMRQGHPGQRAKFVQVEPRVSQTGANADEWVAIRPGTEGVLALGIAHVLLKERLRPAEAAGRAGAQVEGWSDGLRAYTPEQVQQRTGVSAARIERLAREVAENRPAVALIGGAPLAYTNGLFNALAVNALNALLGSIGQAGGIFFMPRPNLMASAKRSAVEGGTQQQRRTVEKLAADILAAERPPVQLLLLHDANPVFGTPPAWRMKDALLKIPYIVSFGAFVDETSALADLILPDHSFLESWVDHVPESGALVAVASVAPPAMRPLHQTRAMPDVLLDVARRLARPLSPALPWENYQEMLKAAFASLPALPVRVEGQEEGSDAWTKILQQGGWWSEAPAQAVQPRTSVPIRAPVAFTDAQFDGPANEYPFNFLPYASQAFFDGSLAHLPWLQELPDVLSTVMWSSWIEVNPQTAVRFGIAQGEVIEIASTQGTLRAPALLSPGIAPDVIAMPVGQGHETFTRFASGRGANPIRILAPVVEPETGSLAWAATRVRISKTGQKGNLILFAGGMKERGEEHR
jgi:anaerobic selenocysteine-containing dehydrogenase